MKMHKKLKGGFTLVELLVVIVIIAALAGLTAPMVMRQRKKADQTEALNNARQVGFALLEFDTEYGRFPDINTAADVTERTGSDLASGGGTTANAFFRQLIAANIANSEQIFYARAEFSKKPDNIFNTASQALAVGEVGFGYLMRTGNVGFSSAGNPGRPIICAPLAFDGGAVSSENFDVDVYDGKAVILKLDNSAISVNINRESKKARLDNKDILQTGTDTVWGTGSNPTIVAPQAQ
jgi:prepilin-type N-terminal cleavage/methylation domain-containing protein